MPHKYWFLTGLLAISTVIAIGFAVRMPFSQTMPDPIHQAQEWASSGRIAETFTPIAYPLMIAPAYRLGAIHGIIALQVAIHIALVAACFFFLLRLGVSARAAVFGSLPVALHPNLLASITKSWDVVLSTLLLVILVLLFLQIQAVGARLSVSLVGGITFAAGAFCRSNYLLLVVALFYALLSRGMSQQSSAFPSSIFRHGATRANVPALAVFAITSILTYCFLGILGHGSPFFPQNGSYNLFAGNNPYSASELLANLNGELSINPAYRLNHPELAPSSPSPDYRNQALYGFYLRSSLEYAFHHPMAEIKLFVIKLFTFFRPDIRSHSISLAVVTVKCVLALPMVLFLGLLMMPGRVPLDRVDSLLLIVYAAYILPFLLINSDPRFRVPLDVLVLLHSVRLFIFRRVAAVRSHRFGESLRSNEENLATFSSGTLL